MPGCRAWNAETSITGGLVSDDLLTIMWNKIAALTGGSAEWPIGLGLRPWYLKVPVATDPPLTVATKPWRVSLTSVNSSGCSCVPCVVALVRLSLLPQLPT